MAVYAQIVMMYAKPLISFVAPFLNFGRINHLDLLFIARSRNGGEFPCVWLVGRKKERLTENLPRLGKKG